MNEQYRWKTNYDIIRNNVKTTDLNKNKKYNILS